MKIELRKLSEIKPYPGNPRHNSAAVDVVAASIREFGFRQPIVADTEGVIIVGHARYKAALKLGLDKVPVHVARDLTPEQIKAYRIADNKTNELSDWNYDLLPIELGELHACNYDLGLLGFDQDELARLLDPSVTNGLCDPDEMPAPPDEATTRPGDLWVIGNHRLLCGDAAKSEDVDRLLDGAAIHLVNTDPPYNVKVEPGIVRDRAHKKRATVPQKLRPKDQRMRNDFISDEAFSAMLDGAFSSIARVLLPGRTFYIWGGYSNIPNYSPVLEAHELHLSQIIIWIKQHPTMTKGDFLCNYECCFYGWHKGAAHVFLGPHDAVDVWSVKKVHPGKMMHLCEKPVELARRPLEYSSRPGENVLDLFGGSGSTLIAAEQLGRKAFLMELDPLYCDVIVQRFEKFTGRKAERIPAAEEATV